MTYGSRTSSKRYKTDIAQLDPKIADAALKIETVTYRSLCCGDDEKRTYVGVIAEQAADVAPHLIQWGYAPEDYGDPDENNERWPKKVAVKKADGFAYDRSRVYLQVLAKMQARLLAAQEVRLAALEAKAGI